jgi:putative spermidine/putrescine transport system substrate-binding protein
VSNDLGVRLILYNLGLMYNPTIYKQKNIPAPTTWDDFWNPALNGHIVLSGPPGYYPSLYIAYESALHGGSESNPAPGIDYIAQHKSQLLGVVNDLTTQLQLAASGQAWIQIQAGITALPLVKSDPTRYGYVAPIQNGAILGWNGLHAVKNSPNPIGAQMFINFLLSPAAQVVLAQNLSVGPVNNKVNLSSDLANVVPYRGNPLIAHAQVFDAAKINASLQTYQDDWLAKMS